MKIRRTWATCLVAGILLPGAAATTRADEGMWPYDHPPLEQMREAYGFAPTQAWLDHLRLASVDPGASAAFVSPDGLVLTNHHVARSAIQRVSTPEHNYVRDGFYAATREQELPLPGSTLRVVVAIEEVTARVLGAVKPGMDAAAARDAREKAIAAITAESLKRTKQQGRVIALYGGAHYDLYRYKVYTDVRLVFAPEQAAAYFGGDWDNFCYPRHDLDIAFYRAYEDGKPAVTPEYLKINPAGVSAGDAVFVSGNPARTERGRSLGYLEHQRDLVYPERISRLQRQRALLREFMARGPEQRRRAATTDNSLGNSEKRAVGEHKALCSAALLARKAADEQALRAAVAADPQLQANFGGAWDRLAAAYGWARAHDKDRLCRMDMPGSRFFGNALQIVRYAAELARPDAERLPGFHETDLADLHRRLTSPAPFHADLEELLATESFQRLLDGLGAEDPLVVAVLQGRTPAVAAAAYVQGTRLGDPAAPKALLADKGRAVAKSDDPLLLLARRIDPLLRAAQKEWRDNVTAVEEEAGTQIANARFAVHGDKAYPDASGSLRFGFGRVAGYEAATTLVPPFTTFHGLYDRALAFGDQGDFALAGRLRERRDDLDLGGMLNFACTADITGGNSGSPLVDREGRFVGVAFDGNETSHANQFVYDETDARCVVVDVRGILQALTRVYDAQPLADEMLAAAR